MKAILETLCGARKEIEIPVCEMYIYVPIMLPMKSVSLFDPNLSVPQSSTVITRKFMNEGYDFSNNNLYYREVYEGFEPKQSIKENCNHDYITYNGLSDTYDYCKTCGIKK